MGRQAGINSTSAPQSNSRLERKGGEQGQNGAAAALLFVTRHRERQRRRTGFVWFNGIIGSLQRWRRRRREKVFQSHLVPFLPSPPPPPPASDAVLTDQRRDADHCKPDSSSSLPPLSYLVTRWWEWGKKLSCPATDNMAGRFKSKTFNRKTSAQPAPHFILFFLASLSPSLPARVSCSVHSSRALG